MLHYLLANLVEARILGQVGYVAVHLSVHLDVLYDVSAVSLQTTVEVMQVLDAANLSCRGVEELSGNGFRYRVVAFLLISRYEVVFLLGDHAVKLWYLVGRVLQVSIHGYDHVSLGLLEAAVQGRALAVVAAELYTLDVF